MLSSWYSGYSLSLASHYSRIKMCLVHGLHLVLPSFLLSLHVVYPVSMCQTIRSQVKEASFTRGSLP